MFAAAAVNKTLEVHLYNVGDYFWITHFGPEKYRVRATDPFVTIYVMRLQRIDVTQPSWWAPGVIETTAVQKWTPEAKICEICNESSVTKYKQGWTCLSEDCSAFHQFPVEIDLHDLSYTQAFTHEVCDFDGDAGSLEIGHTPPEHDENTHGTEVQFGWGIVCPNCGFCIDRENYSRWECHNLNCVYVLHGNIRVYPLHAILEEHKALMLKTPKEKKGSTDWQEKIKDSAIIRINTNIGGYSVVIYLVPDKEGKILGSVTHFRATREICAKPGGPDDYLQTLQLDEGLEHDNADKKFDLKRRPVKNKGRKSHWPMMPKPCC